ncbi:D-alanyl-D-alanine carboxypeptidase/D-alanyl-D-alanine-endopeptidase, partial [Bacteroidota bacterium]
VFYNLVFFIIVKIILNNKLKSDRIIFIILLISALAVMQLNSQILFKLPKQDTIQQLAPLEELQNDLDGLLNNTDFSYAYIGLSVYSPKKGEYLYQRNAQKNFIPASNLKLLTTATALRYLGSDYKFQTRMYLDGEISKNGEFTGDVYLRGYGDPTISGYFSENPLHIFDYFVNKLDSLGIRSVKANIIGDDNFFDDKYYSAGWQMDDLLYPYSAQVNALSVFDNKIDIEIVSGDSIGDFTNSEIFPDVSYVQLVNHVITTGESEPVNLYAIREPGTNLIEIKGNIPYDSTKTKINKISVTIDNPTQFFLNIFKMHLLNKNIRHRGALIDIDDTNFLPDYSAMDKYYVQYSPKLSEVINVINRESHNLASEMLLKTIARETLGFGSTENGIVQVKKFLNKNGIPPDNIMIVDGSGLSRINLISPNNMTTLLSAMYHSQNRRVFISSLAVPGKDGTLKRRMKKSFAEKRVFAKTGTMNNVSTLSGYVNTRDDEILAFSIMIMNYTAQINLAHNLQDLICMRLASFSRIAVKPEDKK